MIDRLEPSFGDLEIQGLLLEILHNPRSRLFRNTPRRSATYWLDQSPAVGLNAPGLTSAEQKLLSSYRDEVAYVLRRIYFELLMQDEQMRTMISLHLAGGKKLELLGKPLLLRQMQDAGAKVRRGFPEQLLAREILECVASFEQLERTPLNLLLASMRLAPHDSARNYMAYEAFRSGDWRTAKDIAERIVQTATKHESIRSARDFLGVIHARRGRIDLAHEVFSESARMSPDTPNTVLSWFASSIQIGRSRDALEASKRIDATWNATDDAIHSWICGRVRERQRGVWSPSRESHEVVRVVLDRMGETARAVSHVF